MAAPRAASSVDWSSLAAKLKPDTLAKVAAFRRRHADLLRNVADLREAAAAPPSIAAYRSALRANPRILDDAQRAISAFRPASLDINAQLRSISEHEKAAVASAQKTTVKINEELVELKALLTDIENARPVEQITVDDVAKAVPELDETVARMVKRGQWKVPGYYEKFGEFVVGL